MKSSDTSSNNDSCVQEEKAAAFTPPAATSQTSDGYGPQAATPHTFDGYGLVTAVDFQDMEATKVRISKAKSINALRVKKIVESTNNSKLRLMKVFALWRERYVVAVRGVETFLSA